MKLFRTRRSREVNTDINVNIMLIFYLYILININFAICAIVYDSKIWVTVIFKCGLWGSMTCMIQDRFYTWCIEGFVLNLSVGLSAAARNSFGQRLLIGTFIIYLSVVIIVCVLVELLFEGSKSYIGFRDLYFLKYHCFGHNVY